MFKSLKKSLIPSIDNPKTFLKVIKQIRKQNPKTPITKELEEELSKRKEFNNKEAWYKDQGEHWQGWLSDYKGPEAYNRKDHKRTSEFIYNHINCPPMQLWLSEALGIDTEIIEKAKNEALKSNKYQTQCASIRKIISWKHIISILRKS